METAEDIGVIQNVTENRPLSPLEDVNTVYMKRTDLADRILGTLSEKDWEIIEDRSSAVPISEHNRGVLLKLREDRQGFTGSVDASRVKELHTALEEFLREAWSEQPLAHKYVIASSLALAFLYQKPMHPQSAVHYRELEVSGEKQYLCPAKTDSVICSCCAAQRMDREQPLQGIIRPMEEKDRSAVMEMMRMFYASPAVLSSGSDEIFSADIDSCTGSCPFLEGFVFEDGQQLLGYGMIAKSFSTEFGRPCVWIEDLYIRAEYRGMGIGTRFLDFFRSRYPGALRRLEVEAENEKAISVYKKNGFEILPYMELVCR